MKKGIRGIPHVERRMNPKKVVLVGGLGEGLGGFWLEEGKKQPYLLTPHILEFGKS